MEAGSCFFTPGGILREVRVDSPLGVQFVDIVQQPAGR